MTSRIIFVNRYFHPDQSATSQLLTDLVFSLSHKGVHVRVITSRQCYDTPSAMLRCRQRTDGVKVRRVSTTTFGRTSLLGRAVDLLSFYLFAGWTLYRTARRNDIVVAMTDPPLLSILGALIGYLRGFRLVNWIQDLYPEIAVQLGVPGLGGSCGRTLAAWRNWSLRKSVTNVAIGIDMAKRLEAVGVPESRLAMIPNWTDDINIVPLARSDLRKTWDLEGKFVVVYSGNLGRAHDIEAFLKAAELLKNRADIVFVFIGGGQATSALAARLRERGVLNTQFRPYQPREMLSHSLGVADVHWLSLRADLDGLIVPSKFYGIAAAGRPVIVVSSPTMELAQLVTQFDCGVHVLPGDGVGFATAITELVADRELRFRMGENARRMLEERFTKDAALDRWHAILRQPHDAPARSRLRIEEHTAS